MSRSPGPLIAALLGAGLTPACSEPSDLIFDPGAPTLATRTEHNNLREPFSLPDVDNPCTAPVEDIDLQGIIHGQGSVWDNGHFKSHYNVTLTGQDAAGVQYQGTSSGNGKGDFSGTPVEDVVISTVISSLGGAPNFVSKIVLHHAADGTVRVDRLREECRGA